MPFQTDKTVLLISLLALLSFSACSSLLYYPERKPLFDPASKHLQVPEEIFFASQNGNRLHGWYFKSKTKKPRGRIVFFHGNAQNVTTHFVFLYWILNEGYDYFIFDYQGYGKSEGRPSPKSTVEDGIAALHWAETRQPKIPLIVVGHSLGGAVALRAVAEAKETVPIRYLVVDSTFHSYRAAARSLLAKHWFTWPLYPFAGLFLSDRYAPSKKITTISPIPILIFHGDQDPVVEFQLGEKVFELARPPKEFIRIPGGRHNDTFLGHNGKYQKELLKRLRKIR